MTDIDLAAIRERHAAWQRISDAGNDDLGEGTVAMVLAGNDVPALLAEVERLTAEVAEMTDLHDTKHRDWRQSDDARQRLLVDRANLRVDLQLAKTERDAMRPVVEAAVAWTTAVLNAPDDEDTDWSDDPYLTIGHNLCAAVNAYTAAQTPGVDTDTSEARTAAHGDAGPADGAVPAEPGTHAPRFLIDSGGVTPIRVEVDPDRRLWITGSDPDGGQWGWRLKPDESLEIAMAISDESPPSPRTWALPAEPGPEVTAVRGSDGVRWVRAVRNAPGWRRDRGGSITVSWQTMLRDAAPLTDATGETP